ncbi:MAG: ankyrin repeat domain-containing protein [Candidatus Babeliales bacterium]
MKKLFYLLFIFLGLGNCLPSSSLYGMEKALTEKIKPCIYEKIHLINYLAGDKKTEIRDYTPLILSHTYNTPQEALFDPKIPYRVFQEVTSQLSHKDFLSVNKDNETPLHFHAAAGNKKIVESLLKKNCYSEYTHNSCWTPLILAAGNGHYEVVEFLIKNGVDVNEHVLLDSWNALMVAIKNGRIEIVELLLKNGAEVSSVGSTPLMLAIEGNHLNILKLIIKYTDNYTALDFLTTFEDLTTEEQEIAIKLLKWTYYYKLKIQRYRSFVNNNKLAVASGIGLIGLGVAFGIKYFTSRK